MKLKFFTDSGHTEVIFRTSLDADFKTVLTDPRLLKGTSG